MLLCAGEGTRLRPITDFIPKCLVPVMGVPVAAFGIRLLAAAGVPRIVANVHHRAEEASAGLKKLAAGVVPLATSDESAQLLGSAGGLRRALPLLGEGAFLYVNADRLWSLDLSRAWAAHEKNARDHGATLTLCVFPAGPPGARYREIRFEPGTGGILALGEKTEGKAFFAGIAFIEASAISRLPEGPSDFVSDVLLPEITAGKAFAHLIEGESWLDVDTPKQLYETHLSLMAGLESGTLPAAWKQLIESTSERVSPEAWKSRASARTPRAGAPSYWGGSHALPSPIRDGQVIYGEAPPESPSAGLAFAGRWVYQPGS